jgi:HEAT repeat protein/beta-lactamase regulating signal transducer with metallopeptidase domain
MIAAIAPPMLAVVAEATVKGTLVLALAATMALALRGGSAARRHLVWTCALAALLVLPALLAALPPWRVEAPALAWLSVQERAGGERVGESANRNPSQAANGAPSTAAPSDPGTAMGDAAGSAALDVPGIASTDAGLTPATGSRHVAVRPTTTISPPSRQPSRLPASAVPTSSSATAGVTSVRSLPWGTLAVAVWAFGALLVFGTFLTGHLMLRLLTRDARVLTDRAWQDAALEAAQRLGLTLPFALLQSPSAGMPVTFGLLRPRVLLPADTESWSVARRRAVLLHELAHVKRHDCLTQALAQVVCALFWFHPGVWWAASRMRVERERACDDHVIVAATPASAYADHLLDVVRSLRAARLGALGAVAFARPAQFEGRLLAVLDPRRDRRGVTARFALPSAAVGAILLLPLAALQPSVAPTQVAAAPAHASAPPAVAPAASAEPLASPSAVTAITISGTSFTSRHAAAAAASERPSKILRAPQDGSLHDRIAWARGEAARLGAHHWWIAWQLQPHTGIHGGQLSDSQGVDLDVLDDHSGALTLDDLLAERATSTWPTHTEGKENPVAALFLVSGDSGSAIERTRVQSLRLPADCGGLPLLWLGEVPDAQSVEWMRAQADREQNRRLRGELVEAVSFHGSSELVVPWLRGVIGGRDSDEVRSRAVDGLGHHPGRETMEILLQIAHTDRSTEVRRSAVEALGQSRTPGAMDALIALAGDPSSGEEVRAGVFNAIGDAAARGESRGEPRAEPGAGSRAEPGDADSSKLTTTTTDPRAAYEQAQAAMAQAERALAEVQQAERERAEAGQAERGRTKAGPSDRALTEAARAQAERAQRAYAEAQRAAEALREAARAEQGLVRDNQEDHEQDRELDGEQDGDRDDEPSMTLDPGELEVQRQAVESLGRYPEADALPRLRGMASGHPNAEVRAQAVESLAHLGTPAALAVVEELAWKSPYPQVREMAVKCLGHQLPADQALQKLEKLARTHPRPDARRMAAEALGSIGTPQATAALERLARDADDPEVSRQAVESLGRCDDAGMSARLDEIARTHPRLEVRRQAAESMGRRSENDAADRLLALALADVPEEVQRQAVESLGRVDNKDVMPILAELARNHPSPEVRRQAVESMTRRDPERALPLLQQMLHARPRKPTS